MKSVKAASVSLALQMISNLAVMKLIGSGWPMTFMVHGRRMVHMVKKAVPTTRFPDAVAVSYSRQLNKLVNAMGKETLSVFDDIIKNEIIKYSRSDTRDYLIDGPFDFFKKALNKVFSAASDIFSNRKVTNVTKSFVKNLNQVNKKNMEQQGRVRGIDPTQSEPWLKDFMEEAVEKNVSYITNIRDDYTKKIENIIFEGAKSGATPKTIRNHLVEQIGMTKRRAKFVAVDQTGTLFGQMTAKRHQQMGANRFRWRTSKDERVRDSHKDHENKVFSYDDPPKEGLPGEDYHCRCIAIPVFDDEEIEITEPKGIEKPVTEHNVEIEQPRIVDYRGIPSDISSNIQSYFNDLQAEYNLDFEFAGSMSGFEKHFNQDMSHAKQIAGGGHALAPNGKSILVFNEKLGSKDFNSNFIQGAKKGQNNLAHLTDPTLAIVAHEYGHAIEKALNKKGINFNDSKIISEFENELNDYCKSKAKIQPPSKDISKEDRRKINKARQKEQSNLTKQFFAKELSVYASTNNSEFFAEAFAEYKLAENPRRYAKMLGEYVEGVLKNDI